MHSVSEKMCSTPDMDLLPKTITRPASRLAAAAQNALEVARFGGLTTDEEASQYEVISEQRVYRLRHYYPNAPGRAGPPVLLVPPLMLAAEVSDVSPTVYSVTPLYHPSGLMMSIGGAVAGGARLAMATRFDPSTFWEETRRYGVTVASYTWTLLHDLVEAPPQPGERHHSVRLFIGSGMPRGLWRRVQERFKPARVLEFYASTEAGGILVNLSGAKAGSMGRPLPGSSEVRIAAYDAEASGLVLGSDGFARKCGVDEIGMLLARVRPDEPLSMIPLRGVFASGDAWLLTGDLFRRDADGDFWRVDNLADVIHAVDGPVFTGPFRDALGDLPAVDLVVAYGVAPEGGAFEVPVAAVTLRRGHQLRARDIGMALRALPWERRPAIVHVVDAIPVTTWCRPLTGPLREAGLPQPGEGVQAWYRESRGDGYRSLTVAARRRLVRQAA